MMVERQSGRGGTNVGLIRARYQEGGVGLVARRGFAKAARLSRRAARIGRTSTGDTPQTPTSAAHALTELVGDDFDAEWYLQTYTEVEVLCSTGVASSALDHYLSAGAAAGNSPNSWFDEQWYLRTYSDVALAKALGGVPSGFVHYLQFGRNERRGPSSVARPTAEIFDGLTEPVGFDRLKLIDKVLDPFTYRVYPATGTPRVNFLVPTLDKELMFGGYIAALNFLSELLDRGWQVRILIVNDVRATHERLTRQFADHALGSSVLARAEVVTLSRRAEVLDISTDDRFVAYSMWTAYHADVFAQAVGRRFLFFIQEYEPTFHHHDSWHALGAAMYDKPHFALFNNSMLRRYFQDERLGVFRDGEAEGLANSAVFEHAMSVSTPPTAQQLVRGETRRLLFYGRPEAHASRNLFEVGVTGIRLAIAQGVFTGSWTFSGVGSLSTEAAIPLGKGYVLNLTPRLPLGDYVEALRGFDVGLSLQYAPHPGVVHFEMAASGMAVVTNTFRNRSAADLHELSANLWGVDPTPEGVARGLANAVAVSRDVEARASAAATGHWVSTWAESFNDDVMAVVEKELA